MFFFKWLIYVCVSVSATKMIDEYFFRQTPEVEKARETWENYKKDYQTSYENMQVKMFFVRFFFGFYRPLWYSRNDIFSKLRFLNPFFRETVFSRMNQVKFVEDSLLKIRRDMVWPMWNTEISRIFSRQHLWVSVCCSLQPGGKIVEISCSFVYKLVSTSYVSTLIFLKMVFQIYVMLVITVFIF